MTLWKLVGGMAVVCAACGGSAGSDPASRAALPVVDAHPTDLGTPGDGAAATDGPYADRPPAAPTWSAIYGQFLVNASYPSNCTGSACHDPGIEKGIDLSSSEKGWSTIMNRVKPGMPDASELVTVLQSGDMPRGRPHMPASDIAQVSAWIAAGAQNN